MHNLGTTDSMPLSDALNRQEAGLLLRTGVIVIRGVDGMYLQHPRDDSERIKLIRSFYKRLLQLAEGDFERLKMSLTSMQGKHTFQWPAHRWGNSSGGDGVADLRFLQENVVLLRKIVARAELEYAASAEGQLEHIKAQTAQEGGDKLFASQTQLANEIRQITI
jgi:hypothetical protein